MSELLYLKHIEAIIFSSEQPVKSEELQSCLNEVFELEIEISEINRSIEVIKEKFDSDNFSFYLSQTGGGYLFLTKPDYHRTLSVYLNQKNKKRLSGASLETLSIIAYKQPVTKSEVEQIRGVNCDYTIQKLLDHDLIKISGRADTPGKPLIYGTSDTFMDYFGINSMEDLPRLKEFEEPDNTIGSLAED